MARGISLHIGLNKVDPSHYDNWDGQLNACEPDAHDMNALAQSRGFESSILLTEAATADAVRTAIERAAEELGPGDFFFITYSGHGGQVPDRNDEDETDRSDETWLLYDRQLVDDELYALWAKFEQGVRIFLLSDSCHSGSVARAIEDEHSVPNLVLTAEIADKQSPRYRALPRDKMISTYRAHTELYDGIQKKVPSSHKSNVGATVVLISGCQDNELARDGFSNGRFTEELLKVWDNGAWTGSHPSFHEAIRSGMPDDQQPNYMQVGVQTSGFEQQDPLTIG